MFDAGAQRFCPPPEPEPVLDAVEITKRLRIGRQRRAGMPLRMSRYRALTGKDAVKRPLPSEILNQGRTAAIPVTCADDEL